MLKLARNKSTNLRYNQLLDLLPKHDWSIYKAAMELGYTKYYAETRLKRVLDKNVDFCRAVQERMHDLRDIHLKGTENLLHECENIIYTKDETGAFKYRTSERLKAMELRMKTLGMLKDVHVEDRQTAEVEASKKEAADRLASIYLIEKYNKKTG